MTADSAADAPVSPDDQGEPASDAPKPSKGAGRGALAIAVAKVWFIVTSYGIQLSLPRLLEDAREFGLYKGTLAGVSILNNVLIVATIQSVSKFVSEHEDEAKASRLLRQGLRIQIVLGGLLAGALFLAAPSLASFLLDDAVTPLLRIACVVVFVYALYGAMVGALNGRRLFLRQAALDGTFSTLRATGIIGGAALGLGAFGALAGWSAAAVLVALTAAFVVRRSLFGRAEGEGLPLRRWLAFMAPIWIYQAALNGVLLLDVQVLKRTLAEIALEGGATVSAAADVANEYVGYYGAAQTFAFVPYQLVIALTFVIFPMISRATSAGDKDAARATIQGAMRFALLFLVSIAAPVAGAADGVLRIAYPSEYLVGAGALATLVFGLVAFALFAVCATALSSAGMPGRAALVAAIAVVVVVVANRMLVMAAPDPVSALPAAALGTSLGMGTAFVLAAASVYQRFRALFAPLTVLRTIVAGGAGWVTAHYVPHDSLVGALLALIAGFVAYVVALVLTAELGRSDLAAVRKALRR